MEENEGIIFLIVVIIFVYIWLNSKLKTEKELNNKLARENGKLMADNALLEAEHLKFQLQPHTLRNMVATLHAASKNLYKGSEALAETLDYILYQGNTHLVSVFDEISFLENYKTLQSNFVYQTNSIKIEKSNINANAKNYHSACLPHLITAYFIENAFKHGDINHPEFLTIKLKLSDTVFEMSVINRIHQKPKNGKGGLGLVNMRKRLDLLLAGKYEIKHSSNEIEYQSLLIIYF